MKSTVILLIGLAMYGCAENQPQTERPVSQATSPQQQPGGTDIAAKAPEPTPATGDPSNVMEFFAVLPDKYFTLEGCDRTTDKDCKKARAEYLKTFTEVSDIKNGYFKGGCDGAQACIEMAIFKRPDGRYLVGVYVSHEMIEKNYFLDHENGSWKDVSTAVVPGFSNKNLYELPREGTTVKVFAKIITEQGDDYEISEKGKKLYDLVWKDGKFTKK
ncbi:MAG TPA: hypothetical protein PLK77_01200 [Pyrinomonadaceae bacterium]|nr:hypothetical protein [Pyrinomonadaceae bacterium]